MESMLRSISVCVKFIGVLVVKCWHERLLWANLCEDTITRVKFNSEVCYGSFILGCIYIRAKATSLQTCCIVSNLCIFTTAATKIKGKNRFRFSINETLCWKAVACVKFFHNANTLSLTYGVFTQPDKNGLYRIYHYLCSVGQCERTINAHLNCAKSKVHFSNPH